MSRDLAAALAGLAPSTDLTMHLLSVTAVVAATSSAPDSLTGTLDGDTANTAGVRYLASYTPAVGDVAVVVQIGGRGTFPDRLALGRLSPAPSPVSITGTTAGTILWSQPLAQTAHKKILAYLNGYENDTTTAQTITFPVPFTETPYVAANTASVPGVSVSTTALTIDPDTTTVYTGWIVVEGF